MQFARLESFDDVLLGGLSLSHRAPVPPDAERRCSVEHQPVREWRGV